ncbi:MAG: glycoside hydrolase [Chloroflexi bacterium]|nr:glycoside hydrolase [Chloroflexota bacterium]
MHQPYYRQPDSDVAILPWVRLHAVKDYLHMAQVAAQYPDVHVTFTLVPSLAEQLRDYAAGKLVDRLMILAEKPYFSPDDKRYLLNICFSIDWDNIIRRYPPYAALLDRRQLALLNPDYFSTQAYRDLIVWFNLAWTDPNILEQDAFFRGLVEKGSDFSIDEARALIQRHVEIVGQVLPTYRRLQDAGQLEIITVPYFHPILPLLVDSRIAQRASPGLPIPDPPFQHPEDADAHIREAAAFHAELMGQPPRGLWPSEGAVSPEILPLVANHGLRWLATDEAILGKSLGLYFERDEGDFVRRPDILYRPYRVATPHGDLAILFRDHNLSDRIGFTYQNLGGEQAAEDMIVRLKHIAHQLRNQDRPGLVSIILDGENAWERYEHNGDVFLHALYGRLQDDPALAAVTVSEHLDAHPPENALDELASGSWILGDFSTWMGDPEHVEAWRRLRDARAAFDRWLQSKPDPEQVSEARRHLFAAEGSDWFWWYSHRNSSDQDALFDQAFLDYLDAAYRAMHLVPPAADMTPIQGIGRRPRPTPAFFTPLLDANPDPTAQWGRAGVLQPAASSGAMQQAGGLIRALRYGNDEAYLYLRLELNARPSEHDVEIHLRTNAGEFLLSLGRGQTTMFFYRVTGAAPVSLGPVQSRLGENLVEMAVPLARLGLLPLEKESAAAIRACLDPRQATRECLPEEGESVIGVFEKS